MHTVLPQRVSAAAPFASSFEASEKRLHSNQVTGHEFLRRTGLLDECPQPGRCIRFGWQIDMFAGFSGATPNLWAMAGYDGMFLRWEGTDAQNKTFMANQGYEWIWVNAPLARVFSHGCVFSARLFVLRVVSAILTSALCPRKAAAALPPTVAGSLRTA